jgi:cobalt-precorrin 5A hydrolase
MKEERKRFAVYAITRHGIEIAKRLTSQIEGVDLFVSQKLLSAAPEGALTLPLPMGPTLTETFTAYDCHVFIISVGAVVRMIAPLMQNKKVDPAVICIDDACKFAICVLSGHVGRGNAFTEKIAAAVEAMPVITTASDAIGTLTVDILGREFGWTLDDADRNVTRGCAAVVNSEKVLFVQEAGEPDWWPKEKPLPNGVTYSNTLEGVDPDNFEILLIASDRELRAAHPGHWENSVIYRPKSLVVGMGCDKNADPGMVERGFLQLLERNQLSVKSVKEIGTIDVKKDEPAFVQLCEKYGWPLRIFTAQELDVVAGIENPSETVKKFVGTRGVSEASALLASGADKLLVPKQIYTEPDAGRSMTFAVARIPFLSRMELHHVQ